MSAVTDGDVAMLEASFLAAYPIRTRQSYATDLRQWLAWLAGVEVDPLAAKRRHVLAWKSQLEERLQPGTVARKLSAVSSFYQSAIADDAVEANPCAGVRRPRVSQDSTRDGLDFDEWERLLATAVAAGPCEEALVRLLGMNGLRISEALAIRVSDLGLVSGRHVVSIVGKGAKKARPPLNPGTAAAVEAVVDLRHLGPEDVVLPYVDRHQAKRVVVQLVKAAGITGKRITPHSLRHTFVTLSLQAGVPLHLVQESARHADPRTTQRYNRAKDQLEQHATFALAELMEARSTA